MSAELGMWRCCTCGHETPRLEDLACGHYRLCPHYRARAEAGTLPDDHLRYELEAPGRGPWTRCRHCHMTIRLDDRGLWIHTITRRRTCREAHTVADPHPDTLEEPRP